MGDEPDPLGGLLDEQDRLEREEQDAADAQVSKRRSFLERFDSEVKPRVRVEMDRVAERLVARGHEASVSEGHGQDRASVTLTVVLKRMNVTMARDKPTVVFRADAQTERVSVDAGQSIGEATLDELTYERVEEFVLAGVTRVFKRAPGLPT